MHDYYYQRQQDQKYMIDTEGPTVLRLDGSPSTTPAWGPGSLECGHVVDLDSVIEDIAGRRVCIDCWNEAVRARRRGVPTGKRACS